MYCEGCGVRLDSSARFCGACGTVAPSTASAPSRCPCGADLEPGARYCEACGNPAPLPARPIAGAVSDARLGAPESVALPAAGARVVGPSKRKRRPAQDAVAGAAELEWRDTTGPTAATAHVPISAGGNVDAGARKGPARATAQRPSTPPESGSAAPSRAAADGEAAPASVATRGGTRLQMAGISSSSSGPSPLFLGMVFVGSFVVVTSVLVAAYSRVLPRPEANGTSRNAPTASRGASELALPAAAEMLRDVRVLQLGSDRPRSAVTATLAFDPRGDLVAACNRDGLFKVWNLGTEREVRLPRGAVASGAVVANAAFGMEGSVLALGEIGPPPQLSVVWIDGKRAPLRIPLPAAPVAIAGMPGHRFRIVTAGGGLQTWNVRSGRVEKGAKLLPWNEENGFPEVVAFSRDGNWFARASGNGIDVWNLEAGSLPTRVPLSGRPSGIAFRGDGQNIAAAVSGDIGVWNLASGRRQRTFEGHRFSVSAVAFSPDGRLLGSAAESEVGIWDVVSGRMRDRLSLPGETFRSVGFVPAGNWMGAGSDGRVRLYRAR